MRIFLVGNRRPGSLESALAYGGRALGHDVVCVPWPPELDFPVPLTIRWPRITGALRKAGKALLAMLEDAGTADIVLIVKGPYISRDIIYELRKRGLVVACWNADDPYDFEIANRGAGVRAAVPAYDHYITWSSRIAQTLSLSSMRVHVVPFACDPEAFQPSADDSIAAGRNVFVGTATRERVAWISAIAEFRPMVFGSGWPRLDGVDVASPIYGSELCAAISQARFNLNFLRPQNQGTHNMRTFEIAACKGRQLAEWSEDHSRILSATGATLFKSPTELRQALSLAEDIPERKPTDEWVDANSYQARLKELLPKLTPDCGD
jgi:spore maturation protein CgeB